MLTGRDSKLIHPIVSDMFAILPIKNSRHAYKLVNGPIMSHFDLRLELLNNTSINCENIVVHIHSGMEVPFLLDVINNFNFFTTLIAVSQSIIDNTSVKPIGVIYNISSGVIFIIYLFG